VKRSLGSTFAVQSILPGQASWDLFSASIRPLGDNSKMKSLLNSLSLAVSLSVLPSTFSLTHHSADSLTDPCVQASSTKIKDIDAQLAYDCLKSIPLNDSVAIALVDSLKPYLEFQTTIITLENPPPEYVANVQPPYSIRGALSRVRKRIGNGDYKGEYEVRNSNRPTIIPRIEMHKVLFDG
jgi:hypothetical protein